MTNRFYVIVQEGLVSLEASDTFDCDKRKEPKESVRVPEVADGCRLVK